MVVEDGNILLQCILRLLSVFVLKELFLCVLDEASQNTLLCNMIWPADHSIVFLKASKRLMFSAAGHHWANQRKTWHCCILMPTQQWNTRRTQNIVWSTSKVPGYTGYVQVLWLLDNMETVWQIHWGKNTAVDKSERKWQGVVITSYLLALT